MMHVEITASGDPRKRARKVGDPRALGKPTKWLAQLVSEERALRRDRRPDWEKYTSAAKPSADDQVAFTKRRFRYGRIREV